MIILKPAILELMAVVRYDYIPIYNLPSRIRTRNFYFFVPSIRRAKQFQISVYHQIETICAANKSRQSLNCLSN